MLLPLLMTTIAGLSTGLGGLIAELFRPTPRLMAFCGGFAGAVMLTVSLADLAPALLDFYGALLSLKDKRLESSQRQYKSHTNEY